MDAFGTKELFALVLTLLNLVLWGPLGFMIRRLLREYEHTKNEHNTRIDELENRMHDLRAELPEKYLSVARFDQQMARIEKMFQWIQNKLDDKADK